MHGKIVWAVEALAFELFGERGFLAVLFKSSDAAVAMFAEEQPTLHVNREAVGTRLGSQAFFAGVATRPEELRHLRFARLVSVHDIARHIGKDKNSPVLFQPHRAFRPLVTASEFLDLRVSRDKLVEAGIGAVDLSNGFASERDSGDQQQADNAGQASHLSFPR